MVFLIKTILLVCVIFFGGIYIIDHVPSIRDRIIEIANPSIKEAALISQLASSLSQIDPAKDLSSIKSPAELQAKVIAYQQAVMQSKSLIDQISDINSKKTGLLNNTLGQVASYIFGNVSTNPASTPLSSSNSPSTSPIANSLLSNTISSIGSTITSLVGTTTPSPNTTNSNQVTTVNSDSSNSSSTSPTPSTSTTTSPTPTRSPVPCAQP